MKVYRVMFHGDEVFIHSDDGDLACGFHVNEYVLANDETQAVEKGRRALEARLGSRAGVRVTSRTLSSLRVESVEATSWLRILRREGLSLYPIDVSSNQ